MQQDFTKLTELARALPDSHRENALALIEEMSAVIEGIGDEPQTWKPPFLRLVQGTTDRSNIPKGTAIGDMLLGEQKLEQPFKFIPLRMWDARQYWDPDQTNARMLCWSPDAKLGYIGANCKGCPHAEWKEEGGNDCGKIKSSLCISADLRTVFNLNFSKSGYSAGMDFSTLLKKAAVTPYARTYGLSSKTSAKAKNVEILSVEPLDEKSRKTDVALLEFLKELFDMVGADRKIMLDGFYEAATARKERLALQAPTSDSNLTLSNEADDSVTDITSADVGKTSNVSELSKSYQV